MHTGHIENNCPICASMAKAGSAKVVEHLTGQPPSPQLMAMSPPAKAAPKSGCCGGRDEFEFQIVDSAPTFPPSTIRNLLYHVYPVRSNGVWRWNVTQLLKRIGLFNGRRIVGIAVDDKTDSADDVKRAFDGAVDEFVVVPNNPNLREVATFPTMLDMLHGSANSPGDATFFGHAKGVTSSTFAGEAARYWAETSYETCLDYWPVVEKMLTNFPVVGPFKRPIRGWKESASKWHYSGSFHWFRNAELFARDWRQIEMFFGGIESYPGIHFSAEEAAQLFYQFERPGDNTLYRVEHWQSVMLPALLTWKQTHRENYMPPKAADQSEHDAINAFHRIYYELGLQRQGTWTSTFWRGVPIEKCPLDMHVMAEIIHEVQPELIVETGTASGGSALYFADLCELNGVGRVITIDPAPRGIMRKHQRVTYLRGSSLDPAIIADVIAQTLGRRVVLVVLDSDHSKGHVLAELRTYAPLVTPGSYIVVEDTNLNGRPVYQSFGPGPAEAVETFLAECGDFSVDRDREKLLVTFNPGGYLKRNLKTAAHPA